MKNSFFWCMILYFIDGGVEKVLIPKSSYNLYLTTSKWSFPKKPALIPYPKPPKESFRISIIGSSITIL